MALVPYAPDPFLPMFHDATRTFTYANQSIVISQDWANSGVAGVVWDAAIVLATYLQTISHQGMDGASKLGLGLEGVKGKRVLELGAGTGLVGIVSCLLGANVVITDTLEALNFTKENVRRNIACKNSTTPVGACSVEVLHWGRDLEKWKGESWDFILGADIVYVKDTFSELFETLVVLTESNKQACVLLSCRIRYQRDVDFLTLLNKKFSVKEILHDTKHDVKIFRAKRNL